MTFDDMKKIQTWGLALVVSVTLHVVVLGALFCSRGCGSSGAPELPPAPVTTDGRATDLPETRAQSAVAEPAPTVPAAKTEVAKPKAEPSPAKPAAKVEPRKPAPAKVEPRKPSVKETKPIKEVEPLKDIKPAKELKSAADKTLWKAYKVKPGDSLTKLSRQCGCTVQELAKANGLAPTANLQLGQTIKIKSAAPEAE